jgi:hypothetical protein
MKFMMLVKATKDSEAGVMPEEKMIKAMMAYNEELVKAGVLLSGEGLHPTSNAVRMSYPTPGGKPTITDGPFTETKELIAGFWMIQVRSKEEALEWARRAPDPHGYGEGQIELRQVFEAEELIQDPDLLQKEAELRQQSEKR